MQQGDNTTVRTQIRDATLDHLAADLDRGAVRAIEWATTDSVDRLALGVTGGVELGDFYTPALRGGSA